MTDIVSPQARSRMMAAVRSKNTKPEVRVRRALHALGARFRLHRRDLPGTPDIVLPGRRLAIFVHGCFWHRHTGCRLTTMPRTRAEEWAAKFYANVARDRANVEKLEASGWRVATIWECETREPKALSELVYNVLSEEADKEIPG